MSVAETKPSLERTTALQSKLYQAAKRDGARRFHALYDKLSLPYVLWTAWAMVRRNEGAAGVDRVSLEAIEAAGVAEFLEGIARALREKRYRPQPVRRVHLPKGEGKTRPLGIPTVQDRVVQAAAKLILEPIFEADFEGVSFGFRPGMGPREALAAVDRNAYAGYRWVVDADIVQFFDTLDHQQLMAALRRRISDGEVLRLIYRWLKAGYLREGEYQDTDQGSPQGGVLSPLLANVYLHSFDQQQRQQRTFIGRMTRYADDFIIQCGTAEQAGRALEWARTQLASVGLRLHPEKTRVVNDQEEGFDFLGFHHQRVYLERSRRRSYGAIRWPGRKACQRFRERIRELAGPPGRVRRHWGEVRRALERYLTGWCQYYRHGQSRRVFAALDRYVSERVARNFARSQPTGRKRKQRYWRWYRQEIERRKLLPRLTELAQRPFPAYRGEANVRWRAV